MDQDEHRLDEAKNEIAVLQSILLKIVDNHHTVVNPGGYLVMEGAETCFGETGTRCIDLTPEEYAALLDAGVPT